MPRRKVNDDFMVGCSDGFHAGSLRYVTTVWTSNKQIIVKIDPADVVSIPLECECQKIRCCKYEVVSEFKNLKIVEREELPSEYDDDISDEDFDDETCDDCGFLCDNGGCECQDDDDENIDIYYRP
jgi:hypothetical protein